MNEEKIGKIIKYTGMSATMVALAFLIFWSACSGGARKPLNSDENKHWIDPQEQNK